MSGEKTPAVPIDASTPDCLPEVDRLDILWRVYAKAQEQIRFADSKAAFYASINIVVLGYVAASAQSLVDELGRHTANRECLAIGGFLLAGLCVLAFVAIFVLISSVLSRLAPESPTSRIFSAHINALFGLRHSEYLDAANGMTKQAWLCDLAEQIIEVSHIVAKKHKKLNCVATLLAIAAPTWLAHLLMWTVTMAL